MWQTRISVSGFTEEKLDSQSLRLKKHARTDMGGGVYSTAFLSGGSGVSKEALHCAQGSHSADGQDASEPTEFISNITRFQTGPASGCRIMNTALKRPVIYCAAISAVFFIKITFHKRL